MGAFQFDQERLGVLNKIVQKSDATNIFKSENVNIVQRKFTKLVTPKNTIPQKAVNL